MTLFATSTSLALKPTSTCVHRLSEPHRETTTTLPAAPLGTEKFDRTLRRAGHLPVPRSAPACPRAVIQTAASPISLIGTTDGHPSSSQLRHQLRSASPPSPSALQLTHTVAPNVRHRASPV